MRSPIHSQRGVAAVELAIVLIPMLVLCFGITELGRALYQYNGLVKATRGAARYLSQQSLASPPAGETADSIRLKARSLALCGAFNCSGVSPLVPNLTLAQLNALAPSKRDTRPTGCAVRLGCWVSSTITIWLPSRSVPSQGSCRTSQASVRKPPTSTAFPLPAG